MKITMALVTLLLFSACGGTPFDEDYWDNDPRGSQGEESREDRLSVDLRPVSALSFTNGDAVIDLSGNAANLRIEMQEVPQNIAQSQVLVTSTSCQNFIADPPTDGSVETRNYTYIENGTRASLFAEVSAGDAVEGKFLVIFGVVKATTTTPASASFPLACGVVLRPENSGVTTGSIGDGNLGGAVSGVVGGFTVGVASGVVSGATAGAVSGVVGGATGGTTGGVTAGGMPAGTTGVVGTTFGGSEGL